MVTVFPTNPIGLKTELLVNTTWTDISSYVYTRDNVNITGQGRPDWTGSIQAGQMTLTLNNHDGRFTPGLATGAYYPYIGRNTQIRISINSESTTLVAYSGYRFWGEITQWPVAWDPTAADVYCQITVSGIWRRVSQNQQTLGSAFRRYYQNLTGGSVPQAYWSLEDGSGSTALVPTSAGTANAVFSTSPGPPSLAANNSFLGSDSILTFNAAKVTATVPAGGTATNNVIRFVLDVPAAGDSASGTTDWNLIEVDTAGTLAKLEVFLNYNGTLTFDGKNSGGTTLFTTTTTTNVKGTPLLVSLELTGAITWTLNLIKPGAGSVLESKTGSVSGSLGTVSTVVFSRANQLNDTSVGHLVVIYGAVPSLVTAATALNGYAGETALTRFARLCSENGIATETIGTTSAAMGPQTDDTLANLLQMIENTDCGVLYEARDMFGLGYRSLSSMQNQTAAAVLSYATATIAGSLVPMFDDQIAKNDWTVTNYDGYAVRAYLATGTMSVLAPPNGIGVGYTATRSVSANADSQIAGIASQLLQVSANADMRYPTITLNMARPEMAALFSSVPSMRIGDFFQITGLPSFLTASTINQLQWGYAETISNFAWTITINAVSELPYASGFNPGSIVSSQVPAGVSVGQQLSGQTSLAGLLGGAIQPSMFGNGITVQTLGGNAVTVAASAPSSPNLNDIWINSTTGLISQWNGSSWVAITFNAQDTTQAGTIVGSLIAAATIVGSNIAASTITSGLIAAGTIVAGIVDGTTVTGATIVADGASGEVLVYSGTPASGNLIVAISGMAGSDANSNSYAQGLEIKSGGLILDNQSSGPTAVSGASTFYSSTAGRPRYLSQSGSDNVLERCDVNVAQFTLGNSTTSTQVSAQCNYQANEGTQGSEYEIQIDAIITTGTGTAQALNFQLNVDGFLVGPHITIGATFLASNNTFFLTLRVRLAINTSTTATISMDGSLAKSANVGSESAFPVINAGVAQVSSSGSVTFTNNAAHTIEIYSSWNGTNSGQQVQTQITHITRRF